MKSSMLSMAAILAVAFYDTVQARNIVVDQSEPVDDKDICCFLYGAMNYEYDADGEDRDYAREEVCLTKNIFGQLAAIRPKSFEEEEHGFKSRMNDNMESYKCGDKVAMEICKDVYTTKQYNDSFGRAKWEYKCTGVDATLSLASPGDRVKRYYKNMNLASAVILRGMDASCIVTYTAYDEPNCEGYSKTTSRSYETRAEMNESFPNIMKDLESSVVPIRSVKHPASSSVRIYAGENFTGGSWYSMNSQPVEDRPGWICTTFRWDDANLINADEPGTSGIDNNMAQNSIEWWYEPCTTQEPEVVQGIWTELYWID